MPKVSVVIPNYNHARYLRQRIETVLAQTYQDFEMILLDDCSTDESRTILQGYANGPRVALDFNEKNSGSTFKQWNKGVRLARGEYIWIAESDDFADTRLLGTLVKVLDQEPDVVFAYCRSWRIDDHGQEDRFDDLGMNLFDRQRWAADFRADGREECQKYFACKTPVTNASAVVFRKTAYERVGGADETLVLCGDWKLWAAMGFEGRIAYVSEPLNYFRTHDSSVRTRMGRVGVGVAEAMQVARWILDRLSLPEAELSAVYKAHAAAWVPDLMSRHMPRSAKARILRAVRAFDPHPLRRIPGPALETIRRSFLRHWRDVRSMITSAKVKHESSR
jgi:hypothetical protein